MMDDRLAYCPYCSTIFSISEAELEQAYGVARCGNCKKIFNASTHLLSLEEVVSGKVTTPLHPQTSTLHPQAPILDESLDIEPLDLKHKEPQVTRYTRKTSKKKKQKQPTSSISLKADRDDEAPILSGNMHFNAEYDTPGSEKSKQWLQDDRIGVEDESKIPVNETVSKKNRVPKEDTVSKKDTAVLNGLPWIPATAAAAMVAVILLLLWSNTRALSQSPALSGFAEALCQLGRCDHFLPSDFDSLEATQTEIIQNNTQLFADFLLNNPGEVPLPFPAILIELRSTTGKVVAEHLYQPDQYLRGKPFADHILPPDLPVALTLPIEEKIQDLSNFTVLYFPAADR
mgnify:CR=1 FL=1